jgi:hypothetical protein
MELHLVDRSSDLVREWGRAFSQFPEVIIELGDILEVAHTALVSPANSYGYMNGGIDLAYRAFFGIEIEHAVQTKITQVAGPYLPVGQAILVETGHARIPYLSLHRRCSCLSRRIRTHVNGPWRQHWMWPGGTEASGQHYFALDWAPVWAA